MVLTSTTVIIECTGWLIKVTDNYDARWKPEIKMGLNVIEINLVELLCSSVEWMEPLQDAS